MACETHMVAALRIARSLGVAFVNALPVAASGEALRDHGAAPWHTTLSLGAPRRPAELEATALRSVFLSDHASSVHLVGVLRLHLCCATHNGAAMIVVWLRRPQA